MNDRTPEGLDRRNILRSAVGGALTAGGCATAPRGSGKSGVDVDAWSSRLDHGLEKINSSSFLSAVTDNPSYREAKDPLARKAVRTLLVAGSIHDLPGEARAHATVERRLAELTPEMDETMVEVTEYLTAQSPADLDRAHALLRDDPTLSAEVLAALDVGARDTGMGAAGRVKLRRAGTHVTGRLQTQPPSLLIDEYVSKVERLTARRGRDVVLQRRAATRATAEELFGDAHTRAESEGRSKKSDRLHGTLVSSFYVGGISLALLGISGALLAGGLLAGLVLLIVGGILEARKK